MAWGQGSEISDIAFLLGVCGVLVSTLGIGDQMSWISIYSWKGTTDMSFCPVGQPEWVVLRAVPSGCDRTAWLCLWGPLKPFAQIPQMLMFCHICLSPNHTHTFFFFFFLSDPFGNRLQTRVPRVPKYFLVYFFFSFYLFIYGCSWSALRHTGFLQLRQVRAAL